MSTAANTPVMRRKPEINSGDFAIEQRPPINLSLDQPMPDREEIAIAPAQDGGKLLSRYMKDLAFAEEPITIRIEQVNTGLTKFQPKVQDCWINGKGAEQLINGKWLVKAWLPVGVPVTTKRKYVETLIRAKMDNVTTQTKRYEESEDNIVNRQTVSTCPISIIRDDNAAGRDWLEMLMREY